MTSTTRRTCCRARPSPVSSWCCRPRQGLWCCLVGMDGRGRPSESVGVFPFPLCGSLLLNLLDTWSTKFRQRFGCSKVSILVHTNVRIRIRVYVLYKGVAADRGWCDGAVWTVMCVLNVYLFCIVRLSFTHLIAIIRTQGVRRLIPTYLLRVMTRGVATKLCLGGRGRIHRHPNPPTPKI